MTAECLEKRFSVYNFERPNSIGPKIAIFSSGLGWVKGNTQSLEGARRKALQPPGMTQAASRT